MEDINFKIGELSGKLDTVISQNTIFSTKLEALADGFYNMEKGRLTALERKHDALEINFNNNQKQESKFSDKLWDLFKIALPYLIMGIFFLVIFYFNNQ